MREDFLTDFERFWTNAYRFLENRHYQGVQNHEQPTDIQGFMAKYCPSIAL